MTDADSYFILFYEYVENVVERRAPFREEHLALVAAQPAITLAGALGDPPHGAAIVFRGAGPVEIEEFARGDPYVRGGLVTRWRIEPWRVVAGAGVS